MQIQDILSELDTEASFKNIDKGFKVEDIPKKSKLGQLVHHMKQRNINLHE